MRLLILGGTRFLGRHLVAAGVARGHQISLFNRGRTNPELFPDLARFQGDRDGGLGILKDRRWDAVIDTCGYVPRVVADAVRTLSGCMDHYTFISSISVYSDFKDAGISEESPVGTLEDEGVEEVNGDTYGPLKALCERAAQEAMPGRVLVIRPGLIVGPHDPTDRFTYWPVRVSRGGEVLAPEPPHYRVQLIDGRDLAEWVIRLVEARQTGIFNATGPDFALTIGTILEACRTVSASQATFTWVSTEFLQSQAVSPWMDLPLWIPGEDYAGMQSVDIGKALAQGLTFRPLTTTIQDTLTWAATRPEPHSWSAGLNPEREKELLAAWYRGRS